MSFLKQKHTVVWGEFGTFSTHFGDPETNQMVFVNDWGVFLGGSEQGIAYLKHLPVCAQILIKLIF